LSTVNTAPQEVEMSQDITIRRATAADEAAIARVAALDSARAPKGATIVASVGGDVRAALPLDGGAPVADPFHRTAELVDLLRLHAARERAGRELDRARRRNPGAFLRARLA
jgi:hypothetical protein